MKLIILLFFITISNLFADFTMKNYYNQLFYGKIGNDKAVLFLQKEDSLASGIFYLEKDNEKQIILIDSSKFSDNGEFQLFMDFEYTEDTVFSIKVNKILTGKISNENTFEGKFITNDGKTKSVLFTKDTTDSWARYSMEKSSMSFTNAEKNFTMSFNINTPKFFRKDKSEYNLINDSIKHYFYRIYKDDTVRYFNTPGDFLYQWQKEAKPFFDEQFIDNNDSLPKNEENEILDYDMDWYSDILFFVYYNENSILTVDESMEEFYGSFHPNNYEFYYNFDLKTQKLLTLEDFFTPDNLLKVEQLAWKELVEMDCIDTKQSLDDQGYFFEDGKFKLTHNFFITPKSLMFSYNPYEIASYARGFVLIELPYEKIKGLLKPNTVLTRLIK